MYPSSYMYVHVYFRTYLLQSRFYMEAMHTYVCLYAHLYVCLYITYILEKWHTHCPTSIFSLSSLLNRVSIVNTILLQTHIIHVQCSYVLYLSMYFTIFPYRMCMLQSGAVLDRTGTEFTYSKNCLRKV